MVAVNLYKKLPVGTVRERSFLLRLNHPVDWDGAMMAVNRVLSYYPGGNLSMYHLDIEPIHRSRLNPACQSVGEPSMCLEWLVRAVYKVSEQDVSMLEDSELWF